ncbi:MAG: N-acetylornithine carbamoyltransferase [Planctomycetes bacterium]|nr:N-acetylornithine carbamoyltransferase [Planctomycetota bacterium]
MALLHVHSLDDLSRERIETILTRAERIRGQNSLNLLAGKTVINFFLSPSLRTRVSMELAAQQLGAHSVTLQEDAGLWKLEFNMGAVMRTDTVEHAKEAIGVLARYGDLLAVRAFPSRKSWEEDAKDPILNAFKRWSPKPVLNLESSLYHPCQSLADILTIRRQAAADAGKQAGSATIRPGKIVLTWADHPKCLPVAVPNSFALGMAQMGWDLTIVRPEGYDLPPEVMQRCDAHAKKEGGRLVVTDDRESAFAGARFVYAKSWGRIDRYGREADEIAERRERGLASWIVDAAIMKRTDNACFMHCLPVRRNVVVADEVIDGPRSIVLDEAENRLHAQKALILEQMGVEA